MIRRSNERTVKTVEHRFGAPGFITVQNLINGPEELNGKGSFFAHVHLLPGHGIGYHVHEKDSEIYYILRGKGEYSDNGTMSTVEAGDVTLCPPGAGHSILCAGDEPLEFVALILYE